MTVFELALKMSKPIDALDLAPQTKNALKRWFYGCTIGDLYQSWMHSEIKNVRGIGKKTMIEIEHLINADIEELKLIKSKADVLDKIRAEIERHTDGNNHCDEYLDGYNNGMKDALEIIDKYRREG